MSLPPDQAAFQNHAYSKSEVAQKSFQATASLDSGIDAIGREMLPGKTVIGGAVENEKPFFSHSSNHTSGNHIGSFRDHAAVTP